MSAPALTSCAGIPDRTTWRQLVVVAVVVLALAAVLVGWTELKALFFRKAPVTYGALSTLGGALGGA